MEDKVKTKSWYNFFEVVGIITIVIILYLFVYKWSTHIVFEDVSSIFINIKKPADFYNNAYSNLVSTTAALFTALVAVAIAVFGIQKWFENKKYDEIRLQIENFVQTQEKDIPKLIQKAIKDQEEHISSKLKELLDDLVKTESKKEEVSYIQSLINAHLSYLIDAERTFFCKEQFKHIVKKMNLNFSEDTENLCFSYHQVLENLVDQMRNDSDILRNDLDLKTAILKILSHLDYVQNTDSLLFQLHSLNVLKEKLISML